MSCTADKGEVLCLVGPNGCGKTTLFRLMLGILQITGGQIRIDGRQIQSLKPSELANLVAYIPQSHTPVFSYTALDIAIMGRASHFSAFESPKPVDREAAFDALDRLNATHLANQKYTSLSGGQRQLVLIARAICQSAKLFIMDEPGANLDFTNQQLLTDTVSCLANDGYCVVMSTHNPEHPLAVGHKVMIMRDGRVAAFGKPLDVITPEVLEDVYGIEMDVVSVNDRYGVKRTLCLPVKRY
ncbi:MAG: ABC transporter ATP-binding protein [Synergistaceae bacterium]|nr:ABC transporter ATP-binding protein [Synergistaceae bacterium]